MTPEKIAIVQANWAAVEPIAPQAADLFYGKLFELDPSLRPLFPEDMAEQKKKLMDMLSVAVTSLTKLDELVPAVRQLGKRHVAYKVTADQYPTVGAALLWTLEQGLGDQFTEEAKAAWTEVYTVLSSQMIEAAEEAA
ncbi:MAG: globin family protein [Planctomycetaceae bacterium]